MAYLLSVAIVDSDRAIRVVHQFYGHSESEVDDYKRRHLASDADLRAAEAQNRTTEYVEEIPYGELPTVADFEEEEEEEEEEV